MFHSQKAEINTKIAEDLYRQLSDTYPDSPNILRQFSALVRDIHGDKKLAEDILAEADQIEEEKAKIAARLLKQRMNKLKQNKQLIGVNNEDMSKAGATHAALAANIFIQSVKTRITNQSSQHWLQQLDNDSDDQNKDNQQDPNNENAQSNVSKKVNKRSTSSAIKSFKYKAILQRNKKEQLKLDLGDNDNEKMKNNTVSKSDSQIDILQTSKEQQIDNIVFTIMYISIFLIIGIFLFNFVYISILFTNLIESTSNQRNALLLSEKMSSAVGYSIYTMFRVLSKDESEDMDEGDSYSIIYQSGFDTVNKTLFEINELFPSVYNYDFNNKIWIDNIVEWNILTFTFPDSAVGSLNPVFTINTSVVENMNIPRFVSWIEDSIMRMSDDFSNFSQVEQQEAVRTPFTTMKEHFAELLFNQPFVAAETLKRICVIALEDLFSMQVEGYIITIIIFVVCLIVLVSGVALPLLFTIRLTKNNRIEAVKDLCAVTSDQAQSVYQQIDEAEISTQPAKIKIINQINDKALLFESFRGSGTFTDNVLQSAKAQHSPQQELQSNREQGDSPLKDTDEIQYQSTDQSDIQSRDENQTEDLYSDRQQEVQFTDDKELVIKSDGSNITNNRQMKLQLQQDQTLNNLPLNIKFKIIKKHNVRFDQQINDLQLKTKQNNEINLENINKDQLDINKQQELSNIEETLKSKGLMNTYESINFEEQKLIDNAIQINQQNNINEKQVYKEAEIQNEKENNEKDKQIEDELEEMKRVAQVRAEDVDKNIRSTNQIIYKSIKIRLFLGILLTFVVSIPNLVLSIFALYGLGGQSGHLVINQLRIQNFIRISTLISVYSSNIVYKSTDPSFIIPIQSVNSTVFKDNSFATDTNTLRNDIQSLNNVLTYQNNKFQLGSKNVQLSGDALTDMVVNPRSQGKNDFINQIMSDETECLIPDDVDLPESIYSDQETGAQRCKNQQRMPGLQYPFKGLEQLLNVFQESVVELLTIEPGDIALNNTNFNYIIESARNDIYYGLYQINDYLVEELDKYQSTYQTVLIVVFILIIVGMLLISIISFLPLPGSLHILSEQTDWISAMTYTVDERLKHFSEVEFDSELGTEVPRVDESYKQLYKSMSVIVNELHEQKQIFESAIKQFDHQMKKMNSSLNRTKTPIPVQESEQKVNSSPNNTKNVDQKSTLQQQIEEIRQSSQILDLNFDVFIWRTMTFFSDQEKLMERLCFREQFQKQHCQDHVKILRQVLNLVGNITKQFRQTEQPLTFAITQINQQDNQIVDQDLFENNKQQIKLLPSPSALSQIFVKLFPDHIKQFDMEFALSLSERSGADVLNMKVELDNFQESRFMHQFIEKNQDVSMMERINYADTIRRIKNQIKEFKENTTKNKEMQFQSQKNKGEIETSIQEKKYEIIDPQQQIFNPLSFNSFQPNQSHFTNYSSMSQSLSSQQQQNQQTPQLFFNPSQIPLNNNFNNLNNNFNQQQMIVQNYEGQQQLQMIKK